MRRLLLAAVACAAALVGLPGTAQAADLPAPTSTSPVSAAPTGNFQPVLTGVRTGRHDAYDRTVFDFSGGTPGWRVEYAPLVGQGQGQTIPVAGAATLLVVFSDAGVPAVDLGTVYNPNLPTLRQIRSGGYFEGRASFGLGVNDRVGFRVLVLHGPERVAVDVAHQPAQPFVTTPVHIDGAAPDVIVNAVRSGSHPGYDRIVFDIDGPQRPGVDVRYLGGASTVRVLFSGAGSPSPPRTSRCVCARPTASRSWPARPSRCSPRPCTPGTPRPTRVLAVCGDDGVTDPAVLAADLPAATTTDPDRIAAWLAEPAPGRRLIVTTQVSAGHLGDGLRRAGRSADILVVDEAHHTAGRDSKHTALLHSDTTLPAHRRLYLTATPRLGDTGDSEAVLSMDDPAVFGPVLARYPFAQAIADGWLDDYRIAIVAVTRAELLPVLRTLTGTGRSRVTVDGTEGEDGPLRMAMVVTALARAATEFDLRRTIVYHPRIATSRAFTDAMPEILAAMPDGIRPDRPLTCHHIDGRHDTAYRRAVLTDLADPPGSGWSVVSNARCLGEGVDVPAVDSVVFAHPKTSPTDIVQAVGRALRRNPAGSGIATILVPVLAADTPTADAHAAAEADLAGYHTVWDVVRAMRAHDETLAAALDLRRQYGDADRWRLPDKIVVRVAGQL
ncbi:hypothetical protein GCM10020218_058640 [Dactylosporangium vinaceum]